MLQWGRDLIVAETTRAACKPRGRLDASMGPRLDSRGNRARDGEVFGLLTTLQWGRDLIVAETSGKIAVEDRASRGFNGAAT